MFDDFQNEKDPATSPIKRPVGLTVICILTFIYSGLSCISYLFYSLNYNYIPEYNKQYLELIKNFPALSGSIDIEVMSKIIETLTKASIWYFILNFLLYGTSLAGAIVMFRLKKVGFHLYAVSQILLLMVPFVYLVGYQTDVANITLTAAFITLYYTNLRIMK